jgi:hypothetical protein
MPQLAARARCHCGSGKPYGECHMAEDRAHEDEQRAWDQAASAQRLGFTRYAKEERFAEPFARAIERFWDGRYTLQTAHQMSEDEALRFFDWFAFDGALPGGERLVDLYLADQGESVDERARALLTAWRSARPASAYAIVAIERPRVQLRDVFTDAESWVDDAAVARELAVGDVLLAHVLPVGPLQRLAGGGARLPPDEAAALVPELTAARDAFLAEQPDSDWDAFLRARGELLTHFAMRQAEAHGRPAVYPENITGAIKQRTLRQVRKITRR